MALKLDELIKKKEPVQILDLSKSTANTKEELKKLLEKVPEFKIKMEKVRPEDVKINDKKFMFNPTKKELRVKSFPFANTIPTEMKCLRLDDLCSIGIQWRMLTSIRPKNKLDEEYYSKLIELGKLQAASREKEKKVPLAKFVRKMKTKSGVLETKFTCCRECGEEFCTSETCKVFAYDAYERTVINESAEAEMGEQDGIKAEQTKRKRRKSTTPKKTHSKMKKRKSTKIKLKTQTSTNEDRKFQKTHAAQKSLVANKIRKFSKYNTRNTPITSRNLAKKVSMKAAVSSTKSTVSVKSKLKQRPSPKLRKANKNKKSQK